MTLFAALLALSAAAGQAADFSHEESTDLRDFGYRWPAEAEALPELRALLRADMEAQRTTTMRWAEEGRDNARDSGIEFSGHYFAMGWEVAGNTPQLLSLIGTEAAFTGGAHGNSAFSNILWDRAANRPVSASGTLGRTALDRMGQRYCAALDDERAERRGEPVRPDADDMFTSCPPLAEQVLAPRDTDGDGRFDNLDVLLNPYVAGPYVEGPYVISLSFEEQDLGDIDAGYRPAFEAASAAAAAPQP